MELYIGGYAQGKLEYVLKQQEGERNRNTESGEKEEGRKWKVVEGAELPVGEPFFSDKEEGLIFNHFHLWIKRLLQEGENPEAAVAELVGTYQDCIVISDEIGNGIVPMEQEEREYRERTGRILTELAAKAERVERVLCGLGQRLK